LGAFPGGLDKLYSLPAIWHSNPRLLQLKMAIWVSRVLQCGKFNLYPNLLIPQPVLLPSVHVPELFHIIWFWGGGYAVSQSVLHHPLSLKACLQCIIVSFEGPKEMRGACVLIPDIFHIIWFCCISVSSPPFFIIEGSFTMYSNVM